MLAPLTEEQLAFERCAAAFWIAAGARLPERWAWLAAVSPLAARVPDSRLIWHPGFRARHRTRLTWSLFVEACGGGVRGLVKLARAQPAFESAVHGRAGARGALAPGGSASEEGHPPDKRGLLVLPSALGALDEAGRFRTSYIDLSDREEVLVFGEPGTAGPGAAPIRLTRREAFRVTVSLESAGLRAFARTRGRLGDRLLLVMEWLIWAAALRWSQEYALARTLDERLAAAADGRAVGVVGSVHEMNAIGRTIWRVAHARGARGHALQHAGITAGKRWYFPSAEEIEAGCALPDTMIVFDREVALELSTHYPGTRFLLGCSSRYASWKDHGPTRREPDGVLLFVGALARFDNDTLVGAVERVAGEVARREAASAAQARAPHITVRLHPAAELPRARRKVLERLAAAGSIELSCGRPLAEDLERAAVVVGMSTTVLVEALLMGRPAIQLDHPDYLDYIDLGESSGSVRVSHDSIDLKTIEDTLRISVDGAAMRRRLGLDHPVVDHATLLRPDALGAPVA